MLDDRKIINDIQEDNILQGDECDIDGVKWKVAAFGEVIDGKHHYISSEEFNRRKKETI